MLPDGRLLVMMQLTGWNDWQCKNSQNKLNETDLDHDVVTIDGLLSFVDPTLHHIVVLLCQQLTTKHHHNH